MAKLYRKEELDEQFIADYKAKHDALLKAITKSMKESAIKTAIPKPDEIDKPRDAQKLLASLMLLGMMADQMWGGPKEDGHAAD